MLTNINNAFSSDKYKFELEGYYVRCTARGNFLVGDAKSYITEVTSFFGSIRDIHKYTLIVDARRQKLLSEDVLPYLEKVAQLYMDTPFANRMFLPLYDAKANTQVIATIGKKFAEMFEPTFDTKLSNEPVQNMINSDFKKLESMKIECQEIIKDIQDNPNHVYNYNLEQIHEEIKSIENKTLSTIEVSKILDIPLKEIYDLIENGHLPSVNNKHLVVLQSDLYNFLYRS